MIYTTQQTMASSSSSSATNGIPKIRMLVMSLLFATGHIIRYVDGLDNKNDTSVAPTKKKILPNFTDEVKKAKLLTKKEDVEDDETEDNDGSEVDEEDVDDAKKMKKKNGRTNNYNTKLKLPEKTTILASNTTFEVFKEAMEEVEVHMSCDRGVFGGMHFPYSFGDKLAKVEVQPGLCVDGDKVSTNTVDMRKLVVLSQQHSGTTWLAAELDRHPQVQMYHEILYVHDLKIDSYRKSMIASLGDWNWQNTYHESLCMLYSSPECMEHTTTKRGSNNNNNVFVAGFGIQGNQGWLNNANLQEILPQWKEHNVHVIVLERRNYLSHHWFAHSAIHAERNDPLVPLTKDMLEGLKRGTKRQHVKFIKMKSSIKDAGVPMHYVTYETLLKTPGESFARIFDFVFGTTTHEKGKSNDDNDDESRWEVQYTSKGEEEGKGLVGNLTDVYNTEWQLKFGGHHSKPLKDKINNYNESKKVLNEIYPEGACMLDEDCDWFYETETTF